MFAAINSDGMGSLPRLAKHGDQTKDLPNFDIRDLKARGKASDEQVWSCVMALSSRSCLRRMRYGLERAIVAN